MTRHAILPVLAILACTIAFPTSGLAQLTVHNAAIPVEGASNVEIHARAGYLKVVGQTGISSVSVRGTARASSSDLLSQIRLVAERRGTTIYIEAIMPEVSGWSLRSLGNHWSALDLDIAVPAGLAVEAMDGSGDAEFSGTGALRIRDGSGNLIVRDIMGEVDVNDGSGDVTITNVTGPLTIHDASGAINVLDVGNEIRIHDGSGEMTLRRVANVVVESDGSGSISIADASGSVRVLSDGSGEIAVNNVAGDFIVDHAGSGTVRHQNVRGTVSVPRRRR